MVVGRGDEDVEGRMVVVVVVSVVVEVVVEVVAVVGGLVGVVVSEHPVIKDSDQQVILAVLVIYLAQTEQKLPDQKVRRYY